MDEMETRINGLVDLSLLPYQMALQAAECRFRESQEAVESRRIRREQLHSAIAAKRDELNSINNCAPFEGRDLYARLMGIPKVRRAFVTRKPVVWVWVETDPIFVSPGLGYPQKPLGCLAIGIKINDMDISIRALRQLREGEMRTCHVSYDGSCCMGALFRAEVKDLRSRRMIPELLERLIHFAGSVNPEDSRAMRAYSELPSVLR